MKNCVAFFCFLLPYICSGGCCQTDTIEKRFYDLTHSLINKLDSGDIRTTEKNVVELTSLLPKFKYNWNYSNAVHKINIVSGRLALMDGKVRKAKAYLLEAARINGSPQLETFGPNMSLAKELLERGVRKEVIEFMDLCESFWTMGKEKLGLWKQSVKEGKVPDFGGNMKY